MDALTFAAREDERANRREERRALREERRAARRGKGEDTPAASRKDDDEEAKDFDELCSGRTQDTRARIAAIEAEIANVIEATNPTPSAKPTKTRKPAP